MRGGGLIAKGHRLPDCLAANLVTSLPEVNNPLTGR